MSSLGLRGSMDCTTPTRCTTHASLTKLVHGCIITGYPKLDGDVSSGRHSSLHPTVKLFIMTSDRQIRIPTMSHTLGRRSATLARLRWALDELAPDDLPAARSMFEARLAAGVPRRRLGRGGRAIITAAASPARLSSSPAAGSTKCRLAPASSAETGGAGRAGLRVELASLPSELIVRILVALPSDSDADLASMRRVSRRFRGPPWPPRASLVEEALLARRGLPSNAAARAAGVGSGSATQRHPGSTLDGANSVSEGNTAELISTIPCCDDGDMPELYYY